MLIHALIFSVSWSVVMSSIAEQRALLEKQLADLQQKEKEEAERKEREYNIYRL